MQRDDSPLFAWQPPRQVLLFPLSRRTGKIRHTASKLVGKQGDDATLYWKQVVSSTRKHLARVGLSDEECDRELRAFYDVVQTEMIQQAYSCRNSGGAA